MRHQNRSSNLKWASTLLSLCLFAGAIDGSLGAPHSSYAQATPPLSAEQTAALAEATRLNQQVLQLYQQGKFNEAIPLAEQTLAIRKRILGEAHPDVATSLNSLALLYKSQGRYTEAEPLYKQALELNKQLLGDRHPAVATNLNNLAELYRIQGRYTEAEPLYKQALELYKQLLGDRHPAVATSLNNLALLYEHQGRYAEAEPLYKQALELYKQLLGDRHPAVATNLNNLAELYKSQGRYAEAEPLYKQALELYKQLLGDRHPDVATNLNNLAELYRIQGRYTEAEPLYKQALELSKQLLGDRHPAVATSLNNLALLYEHQGRYAEAEPLYKQALELYKQLLEDRHPAVATNLNNLAELYKSQGRYAEAEPLYKQALELRKQLLGDRHPDVATSLNNLAELYRIQGRYTEAEPLYKQALELSKQLLGDRHPDVATSLNNLAELYRIQGRYTEAEPLYKQALELNKQLLGDRHPDVATSLNNLASFYQSQGDFERAIFFLSQGMQIEEQNLDINLVMGAEQQKRDYITTIAGTTNGAISLHLQSAVNNPDAARLALTAIFQRKGRILDALTDNLNRLRQNLTPSDQTLLDSLASTRTQLATLYYSSLGKFTPEQYKDRITQLQQQSTQLEADLNNRSATFRTENQPITLAAVQKQIPADAALVELVSCQPFNPKAKQGERFGKPRYAAYILSPQGTIQAVDLGDAAAIDLQAEAFRQALRSRDSRVKAIARKLDAVLMQPIRAKLGNTRNLLISPDSQLNLIPFAALVDEQNRYLVETYDINYLTSGRDLLRLQTNVAKRQPSILFANPDYANPGNPTTVHQGRRSNAIGFAPPPFFSPTPLSPPAIPLPSFPSFSSPEASPLPPLPLFSPPPSPPFFPPLSPASVAPLPSSLSPRLRPPSFPPIPPLPAFSPPSFPPLIPLLTSPTSTRSSNQRSTDLASLSFGPLPGTLAEANAIAPKLKGAIVLKGNQATENALKQVQAPRILHIATHGFFLADAAPTTLASRSPMLAPVLNEANSFGGIRPPTSGNTENALLRSGLALAGFNVRQSGSEDGVLTAQEAAGLDLRGTQLVVLSACETGIGNVANGEGVYGLRRAFVLAGAASQLTSLWQVSDDGTQKLMVQYYDRLLANQGRSDALRQTQLDFLHSANYAHPYYWAAFVPSGDWRSLKSNTP